MKKKNHTSVHGKSKAKPRPVTGREWVESLADDLHHKSSHFHEGSHVDIEPPGKLAEKVAKCVYSVLDHHPARSSQYELPQHHHPKTWTLHMTKEPRKGAHLGFLDRFRFMILKRRIVASRKNSTVAEIRHNPHGIPDFEELYHVTHQHVAFQRRKFFDLGLDSAKRRYAADSILNDYDVLCPVKPSPHLKQISRARDRHRLCLIGRSASNCPFEVSDFMARWLYRRSLQSMELNGMQLTMIKEESESDTVDLSQNGLYKTGKCFASKLVAARKSAIRPSASYEPANPSASRESGVSQAVSERWSDRTGNEIRPQYSQESSFSDAEISGRLSSIL